MLKVVEAPNAFEKETWQAPPVDQRGLATVPSPPTTGMRHFMAILLAWITPQPEERKVARHPHREMHALDYVARDYPTAYMYTICG